MATRPLPRAAVLALLGLLPGCAATSGGPAPSADGSLPASGEFSGHVAAKGEVTRTPDGHASFVVSTAAGVRCTADISGVDSSLTTPIACSDGRNGQAIVSRRHDGTSGTVVVVLDSGTRGRFVFGDLTLSQAFEDGGSAAVQ